MSLDDSREQIPLFEIAPLEEKKKTVGKLKPVVAETMKESVERTKSAKRAPKAVPVSGGIEKKKGPKEKSSPRTPLSGQVPEGDVRLTANIREDLHLKLKIVAARRRTTIGEMLEELVEKYV